MADTVYRDVVVTRGIADGAVRVYKVKTSEVYEGDVVRVETPSGTVWAVVEAREDYVSESELAFWERVVKFEDDEIVAAGKLREVVRNETV